MIRRPLRPLARVLQARSVGDDPDRIEAENRAARMRQIRAAERRSAEFRVSLVAVALVMAFGAILVRMTMLAATPPEEPERAEAPVPIATQRADIVDRNGNILATNLLTASLYAHPHQLVDPVSAAAGLARIFPDLDEAQLLRQFAGNRRFLWVRRKMSPEQQQAVYDLGEPGLLFGPRELRLYPNGRLAAHVMGGTRFGNEGVHAAELVGVAGVELVFDAYLRDPANAGAPLRLSIDLTVQQALERVLAGGVALMNARGAAAVVMEADTGRIVAMASLPDFDPNHRPAPPVSGQPADSPLFNRAAQGTYELGSSFKTFTIALALERGLAGPETLVDSTRPLRWGRFTISDEYYYGPTMTLTDVLVRSSNTATARLARDAGGEAQRALLRDLGLLDPTGVELPEAARARPQVPPRWSELSTLTISYGHGLATTPLHLASAYATVVNGGYRVQPTLLAGPVDLADRERVISAQTSAALREMLRQVVVRGTATLAEVEGYEVGGKTGTAIKPNPRGGYYDDRVISNFAGAFPMSDPRYVLVVVLDEPENRTGSEPRRSAGWTAVPVAAEIVRRVAPLLELRPLNAGNPEAAGLIMAAQ